MRKIVWSLLFVVFALALPFGVVAPAGELVTAKAIQLPKRFIGQPAENPRSPTPLTESVKKIADLKISHECYIKADKIGVDESWRLWVWTRNPGYSTLPPDRVSELVKVYRSGEKQVRIDIGESFAAWCNLYTDKQLRRMTWKGPEEDEIGIQFYAVEHIFDSRLPGQTWKTVPEQYRAERIWSLREGDEAYLSRTAIHIDQEGSGWVRGGCSVRRLPFRDEAGPALRIGIGGKDANCFWVDLRGMEDYTWIPEPRPSQLNTYHEHIPSGEGVRYRNLVVWYWYVDVPVSADPPGRARGTTKTR